MADDKRPTEENAIDNLNAHLTSAGEKVANNKKYLLWGVAVILLIGAFCAGYFWIYRNPRLNKSYEAYAKVEMEAANDTIAAESYKKVADNYSGTPGANLAALAAAERLYDLGKYDEAVKYLEKFDADDDVIMANALVLTGDCYVNLKKYDNAIASFQQAVREAAGNEQIVPRVLIKEANVYDAQKKYDKALECYTQIKNEFPEFVPGNGLSIDAFIERENARLGK